MILNIEQKKTLMGNLIKLHTIKRNFSSKMDFIKEYIAEVIPEFDANEIKTTNDLFNCCDLDLSMDFFDDLNEALNNFSSSMGDPYYVYHYSYVSQKNITDFINLINQIKKDVTIYNDEFDVQYLSYNDNDEYICIKTLVFKYNLIPQTDGTKTRDTLKHSVKKIDIIIMKTSNKLYFHTGDKQFLKVSGAFFEKNVYSVINLKPLIVDDNTINDSFISLDLENKITIFMLELCIKVLDQHPNKIDTHKNLRVKNLKAKNLKTLTASGTKLFNDTVIYDKIKEGSTVVSICLKMTWHNTESNCAELLEIQIYNLGCLKITINEPRNSPFRLEIVNFISQSITTLLSQKLHIPKNLALPYYFGGVMSRDAVLKSMVCEAIKEKLVKEESLLGHVKTVTSIINTYKKES